jgi:hypothetical protein
MASVIVRIGAAFLTVTLGAAGAAYAQSTYVGASVLADIARFNSYGGDSETAGGEAFGGALRVGTAITDRWGLDLEFTRPGEIEQRNSFDYAVGLPLGIVGGTISSALPPGGMPIDIGRISMPIPFSSTTTRRSTSLAVMPYVRQAIGSRADIVYLGGLAFLRTTSRMSFGGGIRPLLGGVSRYEQTSVTYGSAPAVGLDVRVMMTDSVRLVPGVRLLSVDDNGQRGWLARPSIGLQWAF